MRKPTVTLKELMRIDGEETAAGSRFPANELTVPFALAIVSPSVFVFVSAFAPELLRVFGHCRTCCLLKNVKKALTSNRSFAIIIVTERLLLFKE